MSGGCGCFLTKRSGFFFERDVEDVLPGCVDGFGLSVMNLVRGHEADPGVVMVLIVPCEEVAAKRLGVFDTTEPLWKSGLVLQGLEVAFGKRVVV